MLSLSRREVRQQSFAQDECQQGVVEAGGAKDDVKVILRQIGSNQSYRRWIDPRLAEAATLVGLGVCMIDLEEVGSRVRKSHGPPVVAGSQDHHLTNARLDRRLCLCVEESRPGSHRDSSAYRQEQPAAQRRFEAVLGVGVAGGACRAVELRTLPRDMARRERGPASHDRLVEASSTFSARFGAI
jgi:hypothetical protein